MRGIHVQTTISLARTALAVLLCGLCGCVSQSPYPSEATRAQFKTIGVVAARFAPDVRWYLPAKGGGEGAARGSAIGAMTPMAFFAQGSGSGGCGGDYALLCAAPLALGLALAPLGAVVGAVAGAVSALPAATVEEAEANLQKALAGAMLQEKLRDSVVRLTREQTRYLVVKDEGRGPRARDERADYREWTGTNVDTVLEVSIDTLILDGPLAIDPTLRIEMVARAKLIRTHDGVELHDTLWNCAGAERLLAEWIKDGAKPLRDEVARCMNGLAGLMVEALFLNHPL